MTKTYNEDFKNSTKYWIIDNTYIDGDVKVRDHCHITGKYRRSTHRNCNINVKLNHKFFFHKLNYIFHNVKTMIPILSCKK